jgi:hypothetical protein
MARTVRYFPFAALAGLLVLTVPAFSQSLPHFGIGAKASTLGFGGEVATAVTRTSNLRFGYNALTYSGNTDKDGIYYAYQLKLRSAEVLWDQYLVGGLHLSPGFLVYNGNGATATASVSGSRSFSLGDITYYSSASNPVTGSATLTLGKAAPMVLIGIGNPLPRSGRHFAANFEAGVVFEGSPKLALNLTGSTCLQNGTTCVPISSNPNIQANIQNEQNKVNDTLKPFKYYPVISFNIGISFGAR